jgi:type IV pilus assembly protein PilF
VRGGRILAALALSFPLLLAGCAGPSEAQRKEASARMQIGVTFLQQQRLPDAMRQLARAEELDPANPEIDLSLGGAYLQRHLQGGEKSDLLLAERYLRAAIRKKKNYAEAHNYLGVVLGLQGKGDDAIEQYRIAGENVYYSTPERAYFNMGNEFRRQRKPELAEKAFRRSIALNELYVESYLALSNLLEEKGMPHEAGGILESCSAVAPADRRCRIELARLLRDRGRTDEARRMIEAVLRENPEGSVKGRAEDILRSLGGGAK